MSDFVDYSFTIDGAKPSDIPMARIGAYIVEYAKLLGSTDDVRFGNVTEGSAVVHASVPVECVPLVNPRLRASVNDNASSAGAHFARLNSLLAEDGWSASITLPKSGEMIVFPGRGRESKAIRTVTQSTTVQGRLIRLEGAGDVVHIGLDMDSDLAAKISIAANISHDLASQWHRQIRITGDGRWKRDQGGRWILDRLFAKSFEPLDDAPIGEIIHRLQKFVEPGSSKDIIAAVKDLRRA